MASFFEKLKNKFAGAKEVDDGRISEFRLHLHRAVADGKITDSEAEDLRNRMQHLGLSQFEISKAVDSVYFSVVGRYTADRRITDEERASIEHIGKALGVSPEAISSASQSLDYFALLHALETSAFDDLPATYSSNLILAKNEIDYFGVSGSMLEERVVRREMVGGSHGVSIPLVKGIRYRVGQSRGQLNSITGIVPVSYGEFTVTNQRLAFSGDKKSVNAPFAKIQHLEMFADGLRFSMTNRQKPITIQFYTPESTELIGMYISRVLNQ
jgi:hypothetical protein